MSLNFDRELSQNVSFTHKLGEKYKKSLNEVNRLRNDVERWLIHENYSFKEKKQDDFGFCFQIKDVGSFRMGVEIFEPQKQPGVLVLGGKIFLQNRQTARYLKLTDSEREKFHGSIDGYCNSIGAIHKILREDGKVVIGVYVVLDKVDRFTQEIVFGALNQVTEMGEKTNQFIMKTF